MIRYGHTSGEIQLRYDKIDVNFSRFPVKIGLVTNYYERYPVHEIDAKVMELKTIVLIMSSCFDFCEPAYKDRT